MPAVTAQQNDAYEVRVRGTQEGQETNNVFHFVAATAIDDVELRLIAALAECFITHLIPVFSSAWTMKDIVWKQVTPVLGVEHIFVPQGALVGAGNAAALPTYASAVISKRTLQGGKSHRGRFYLPGIPEAATLGSAFDTNHAFWAALAAFVACVAGKFILGDPPGANSFQMMVYSRKIGGATAPYGANGFTAIADLIPVVDLATTRSRKVKRGS